MPEQFVPPKSSNVKVLSPQMPKEPPKEVLEREFKMDDSLFKGEIGGGNVTIEDTADGTTRTAKVVEEIKKSEETPKVEEAKKEEVKPKEETKVEETKPSILKPPKEEKKEEGTKTEKKEVVKTITPSTKVQRDYTGYSAEEVAHFKQMSDPAYEFATKLIKENKELSKNQNTHFFQDPRGYIFIPEFNELQTRTGLVDRESRHWMECLVKLEKGEPIKPMTGWDEKGNPVYDKEYQPSKELEEAVRGNLLKCRGFIDDAAGKLESIKQNHSKRVNEDLQAIENERKTRFDWVANPKVLDYTVNIEGLGDVPVRQVINDFTNLFPPYLRHSPGVQVAADLFVSMQIQAAQLREATNGKQVAEIKKEEAIRGEPSSNEKPRTNNQKEVNGVKEFVLPNDLSFQ